VTNLSKEAAPEPSIGDATPLVSVTDLKVHFPITRGVIFDKVIGHVKAVDGVDLAIPRGRTYGLVGESGCGKSTLGRAILQLTPPTSGSVSFDGVELTTLGPEPLRKIRRRMQMIFQDPLSSLDPRQNIESILVEGLQAHGIGDNRSDRRDRVSETLDAVGLPRWALSRYPHEFSGGQRQRIGIARALAVEPEFIVADEPLSALDVSIQSQVINLLAELRERLSLTMLFISHDLDVVEYLCDRVVVLYLGHIMEIAPTAELFARPLHPYSRALLAASPKADPTVESSAVPLQGDIPSPVNPPSGCVFRTRCPLAIDACAQSMPALDEIKPGRFSACIRKDLMLTPSP